MKLMTDSWFTSTLPLGTSSLFITSAEAKNTIKNNGEKRTWFFAIGTDINGENHKIHLPADHANFIGKNGFNKWYSIQTTPYEKYGQTSLIKMLTEPKEIFF